MAYCTECGAEVEGKAKFCTNCGTPVPKRGKRPVITKPEHIPPPKVMPGEIRPTTYKAERPGEAPSRHEIPASEIPKDRGQLLHPSSAVIKYGKSPEERVRELKKQNRIGAAIAIPIIIAVVIGVPWLTLGYPIWEIFEDGGGGGLSFDGTYAATVTTNTPIGITTLQGTFTVVNGWVSDPSGVFTGTVDADGYFTGTTIVSPGSPPIAISGWFSNTGTFTLSGGSGNASQTIVAYRI
ncbi:MAG: zinc ribbon domain-containing protein [Methanobacteriota archaeon]